MERHPDWGQIPGLQTPQRQHHRPPSTGTEPRPATGHRHGAFSGSTTPYQLWNLVMVISTSPQPPPSQALIEHLRQTLGLSEKALNLGLRQAQQEQAPLPVVLWRYGLISLEQLDELLHWQDQQD